MHSISLCFYNFKNIFFYSAFTFTQQIMRRKRVKRIGNKRNEGIWKEIEKEEKGQQRKGMGNDVRNED